MSRIMKRKLSVLLLFAAAAVLGMAGCASGSEGSGSFGGLSKTGIAPYECSDSESVSMTVTISRLEEGRHLERNRGGTISSGDDLSGREPLSGALTMKLEEDPPDRLPYQNFFAVFFPDRSSSSGTGNPWKHDSLSSGIHGNRREQRNSRRHPDL